MHVGHESEFEISIVVGDERKKGGRERSDFKRWNRVDASCVVSNRFFFLIKKEKKEPKINNRFRFVGTFVNGNGNNAIVSSCRNSKNIIEEI